MSKPNIKSTIAEKTVQFVFYPNTHIDWVIGLSLEYAFKFSENVIAVQGDKTYRIIPARIKEWIRRQND